jgi:hypothetical protein
MGSRLDVSPFLFSASSSEHFSLKNELGGRDYGQVPKKLPANSLQSEALRPRGFVEFVSASSRDFTRSERQSLQNGRGSRFWADAINIFHRGTQ